MPDACKTRRMKIVYLHSHQIPKLQLHYLKCQLMFIHGYDAHEWHGLAIDPNLWHQMAVHVINAQ